MKLYFYTGDMTRAATTTGDLSNLITALADPTTETNAATLDRIAGKIPDFVHSDTGEPIEFYFYESANVVSTWSTDSNVSVTIGLGDPAASLDLTYASLAGLTVSSNARVGTLSLNTTNLANKLHEVDVFSVGPFVAPPRAPMVLQVRKSTGGVTETVSMLPVNVSAGVLSTQPAPLAELSYTATVPATSTSTGTAGQWSYDSSYFYLCVAENTWRRFPLNDWA